MLDEPILPEFDIDDFSSSYIGTEFRDEATWTSDFTTTSQFIQTLGGDDFIAVYGSVNYLVIEGGSGDDYLYLKPGFSESMIITGGIGNDNIQSFMPLL